MNAHSFLELPPTTYADYVLPTMLQWQCEGLRTALLTVVRIDGSSPRPLGSQLAVAEDGRSIGAVTGGCAEPAIIRDALVAIAAGTNHLELYGKGSRFKDITLPCGSGIHIYFDVTVKTDKLKSLVTLHDRRQFCAYECQTTLGPFTRDYSSQRRLVILGRGHIVPALAQVASISENLVFVFCPDSATREQCLPYGTVAPLRAPNDWDSALLDQSTALVSLFHDHDNEPEILDAALRSDAFYIGALGSRRTHEKRLESLQSMGWPSHITARINGPVGLNINAKTPPEIAIAIIAEIIHASRSSCSHRGEGKVSWRQNDVYEA